MKRIVLTGGGTAGHVTPNIALIRRLKEAGYEITYIGSKDGIEQRLIGETGIQYYGISSGKLRRYFSMKNFTDMFRVMKGYREAKKLIKEIDPDIVFSKGGYVTVPVIFAANHRKIPVIVHESDMTVGLANKLGMKKAVRVCTNFPETVAQIAGNKAVHTGTPIREELFLGNAREAIQLCEFKDAKPIILIIGGSLGSKAINNAIRMGLDVLLKEYNIIHICGKNNRDIALNNKKGYFQLEYARSELKDLFAAADVVISRAGANVIFELLALKKPMLLIPLPAASSRGDQIMNAESFKKSGFAEVMQEETISTEGLLEQVNNLYNNKDKYISAMEQYATVSSEDKIIEIIKECTK